MDMNSNSVTSNAYYSYATNSKKISKGTSKSDNSADSTTVTKTESTASTTTSTTTSTKTASTITKTTDYGKTIGNVKLSDTAAQYYQQLKQKYGNMDFVLVSSDQKANVSANAATFSNPNKMAVLIDADKIEKMASDKNYREQYENTIQNASSGISQMKTLIERAGMGRSVQGYGMLVNDGGASSFFAVMKKSFSKQKEQIDKNAERKAADKKEEKKIEEKKAQKNAKEKESENVEKNNSNKEAMETQTITANSLEELLQKMNSFYYEDRSNSVLSEAEQSVGQSIDFKG